MCVCERAREKMNYNISKRVCHGESVGGEGERIAGEETRAISLEAAERSSPHTDDNLEPFSGQLL